MKKLLLITAAVAAVFSTKAQHTLTATNTFGGGDVQYIGFDTIPNAGISAGSAGAGMTYDISDFDFDGEVVTNWLEATALRNNENYPEATHGLDQGGTQVFFKKDVEKMVVLGVVAQDSFVIRYSDTQKIYDYPSSFNTGFNDTYYARESFFVGQNFQGTQVDSGRITIEGTRNSAFDGSGSLKSIAGNYNNIIRERAEVSETQTFELCINPGIPGLPCQWTEFNSETTAGVEYNFYGADSKFPLGGMEYNPAEDTLREVFINSDPTVVSISEYEGPAVVEGGIYPNPVKTTATFTKEVKSAVLVNQEGKEIAIEVVNNKIDLSSIANGVYTVVAVNKAGFVEHHPIIVAH